MTDQPAAAVQPRARGSVRLATKARAGKSVLRDLYQAGSAKVVFPRSPAGLQAVTVNTAGGITGGDQFDYTYDVARDTHLTLTTQAAERAYGSQQAETGRQQTTLRVESGGRADWVPQETILFNTCRFARAMRVELAQDARLLFVEPLVFGRAAMGEVLSDIAFHDRVDVYRGGAPLFCDAMTFRGDARAHMARVADGAGALASVVYVAPDAGSHLDGVRAILPQTAGASLIGEDLLHVRFLAQDGFALRASLIPVLTRLSNTSLPRAWMI